MRYDDFDTQVQCEEYYHDPWEDELMVEPDPDDDDVLDESGEWWDNLDPYGEEDPEWDPAYMENE